MQQTPGPYCSLRNKLMPLQLHQVLKMHKHTHTGYRWVARLLIGHMPNGHSQLPVVDFDS
eukprot:1160720-Pelagomonas_calceolata.AAC.6